MKFLQELVRFNRLDDEEQPEDDLVDDPESADPELDASHDDFDAADFDIVGDEDTDGVEDTPPDDFEGEQFGDTEEDLTADSENPEDQNLGDEMGDGEPTEPEDPDRQGLIRTVNKAHLIYKRKTDDGTYDEMWMYNVSNLRDNISVRKAILAGTDIPPNRSQSPDGSQSYELWTAGNAEMMLIKGLPQ